MLSLPPASRPWLARLAAAASIAGLTAGFLLTSDRNLNPYDEGIVLTGAMRLLDGAVPHRDFYVNYGPGQFAVLAALFHSIRPAVWVERVWDALVHAAIVALVYRVAAPAAGRVLALAAALAAGMWLAGLSIAFGYPLLPAIAAGFAGLAALRPALHGNRRAALAAGMCFGIVTLFRYDVGVALLAAGSIGLLPIARAMLPFVLAGFTVIALPLLLTLAALGALPGLWFDVIAFPAQTYAATRALPAPSFADIRTTPIAASVFLPPLACLAALPALVQLWYRNNRAAAAWLLCLALATLVLYAKGLVRLSPRHIAGGYLAALPLLAAAWRTGTWRPLTTAVAAGFAFCSIYPAQGMLPRLKASWRDLPASCAGPPRLACMIVDQPTREAIAYVDAHTGAADPIFVGLPAHDRIFANDVAFYFLAARVPATKWYHFDPGLQTSLPIQQAIVRELQSAKPKLVVLEDVFTHVVEPNASARSSGVRVLDRYIAAHYAPAATFQRFQILQSAGMPSSAAIASPAAPGIAAPRESSLNTASSPATAAK